MSRAIYSVVFLGLAAGFGAIYFVGYRNVGSCFNELGRCFDAETGVVYEEQSGIIWLLLAVLALGAGLYTARLFIKTRR